MARARNIKPGLMENELLAELSHGHRLLFIYLWMLADRDGRIEDRPKRIKGQAFPYDGEMDIDGMLQDLADAGFILRYCTAGVSAIQVLNFAKHQTPHVREKAGILPSPMLDQAEEVPSTDQGSAEHQPIQCHGIAKIAGFSDSLIEDSLIPDSLIGDEDQKPLVASVEATGDQAEGNDPNDHPDGDQDELESTGKAEAYNQDFELFWAAYPKRHRSSPKAAAWRVWRARIRDGEDPKQMIVAAGRYAGEQRREGKTGSAFVKLPGTFLGPDQHWREYLGEQPPPNHPSPGPQGSAVLEVPTHTQEMYPDDHF